MLLDQFGLALQNLRFALDVCCSYFSTGEQFVFPKVMPVSAKETDQEILPGSSCITLWICSFD